MACKSLDAEYTSVVENLIKSDSKYQDYDNAVNLVLSNDVLDDEQKKMAVHYFASIYNGLVKLDPGVYKPGKLQKVLDITSELAETKKYLELVNKLYSVKDKKMSNKESILSDINSLSSMPVSISLKDLSVISNKIKNHFSTTSFKTEADMQNEMDNFKAELDKVIGINGGTKTNKANITKKMNDAMDAIISSTEYVDLNEIQIETNKDARMVFLKDGTVVEAVETDENVFAVYDPATEGIGDVIPSEAIDFVKHSRPHIGQIESLTNGEVIITKNAVNGAGFQVKAVDASESGEIHGLLNDLGGEKGTIEIKAIRISDVADSRVQELHKHADNNPQDASLLNRSHETFETPSQIEILSKNKGARVISMRRPNSEDKVGFVGTIKGTDHRFNLFNLDNLTVVDSSNNTTPLDLNNPDHVALLKEMAAVPSFKKKGYDKLTDEDIDKLIKAFNDFQAFKAKAIEALAEDPTADVTELFYGHYSTGNTRGEIKEFPLKEVIKGKSPIKHGPNLGRNVTVVTVDKRNQIVEGTEEEMDLPVHFTKWFDKTTGKFIYKSYGVLPSNKRILITNESNGETMPVNEGSYISHILGLSSGQDINSVLDPIFKHEYKNIATRGQFFSPRFLLKFNEDGTVGGYQSINYVSSTYYGENFMDWAYGLMNLNIEQPGAVRDFDKARTFKFFNIKGEKRAALRATFGVYQGQFNLEIRTGFGRAHVPTKLDEYVNKQKKAFNVEFKKLREDVSKTVKGIEAKYIPKVLEEHSHLEFDATDEISVQEFYAQVYKLSQEEGASQSVKDLVERIDEFSSNFSETLANKVDQTIKDNFQAMIDAEASAGSTKLLDILKEYYKYENEGSQISDYNFRPLVVDDNVGGYLNISTKGNKQFRTSMENIMVPDINAKQFVIESLSNSKPAKSHTTPVKEVVPTKETASPTEEKIDDALEQFEQQDPTELTPDEADAKIRSANYAAAKKKLQEEKKKAARKKQPKPKQSGGGKKGPTDSKGPVFSIEQEAEGTEGLDTATAWLGSALPQFELERQDLGDIMDLTQVAQNGYKVLGAYKDRVIFLDKQMGGAGTLYHEAFHAVFRNLMDSGRRDQLIDAIQSNKKYKSKFSSKAVNEFARVRGISKDTATLKRLIAEEILADGFKSFMQKKSKPRGILAQFFQMLAKILGMFRKKSRIIDTSYRDISEGVYSSAELGSQLYAGEYALEAIPGVMRHFEHENGNHYAVQTLEGGISSIDRTNLVNLVVSNVLQDTSDSSFDEKFSKAAEMLIYKFDIEEIIDQNPEKEAEIRAKYSGLMSNYRFMLGARLNTDKYGYTYDENRSSNDKHDHYVDSQIVTLADGTTIDNTNGAYSRQILKDQVKATYGQVLSVQMEMDEGEIDDAEQILEGELEDQKDNNEDVKDEVDSTDGGFDDGYGQQDVVNQVRYVRSLLATVEINQQDELGVTIPKVVDATSIFPVLLKITAGVDPANIISSIKTISEQMREDGYMDTHYQLQGIYDRIVSDTNLDINTGIPAKNTHIYDMFIEVLNVVELDYTMIDMVTPEPISKEQVGNDIVLNQQQHKVNIKDSVLNSDIREKKDQFVQSMILKYTKKDADAKAAHLEAIKKIGVLNTKISKSDSATPLFVGSISEIQDANELANEMHSLLQEIGLDMPKSLIKMSLIAIDAVENEMGVPSSKELADIYDLNEGFIEETKYLEKKFFSDLSFVLSKMYLPNGNRTEAKFLEFIEEGDFATKNLEKDRFFSILRKSSEYIIKFDPQNIQSVIKNAEGKNIYRYAKYNPLVQISQMIRRKGLVEVLKSDPYYASSLKYYMEDNPVLGEYLRKIEAGEELTEEDLKVELYLNNLNVSMLGGIQQRIGKKLKEGKSFKGIEPKSQYLIYLASFMTREEVIQDEARVTLYKRQFHQLESTQTNFLINSMYKPYTDNSTENTKAKKGDTSEVRGYRQKGYKLYEEKYVAVVEDLVNAIEQEYKRIGREIHGVEVGGVEMVKGRDAKKEMFDNNQEGHNLVLKYNAKYDKNGNVDVSDKSLRAYRFNRLKTFWDQVANTDDQLQQKLYDAIEAGMDFSELDEATMASLKENLNKYALNEFQAHLSTLEDLGVVESVNAEDRGYTFTNYTSKFLPQKIKNNYDYTSIEEAYSHPTVKGDSGLGAMVFDAFMNHWASTLNLNQIFDGDVAMGVKDDVDLVKRYKKFAAAGSNMKQGTHKVAYVNTIEAWTHNSMVQYGPYTSLTEIENDISIQDDAIRNELMSAYSTDIKGTTRHGEWYPIFDGQSISSLMHQMDMYQTLGRMTPRAKELLIKKHYTRLTADEVKELKQMRIVNNSKKTVTAGRYTYHKLSEYYIDRNDVSYLSIPGTEGMSQQEVEEATETRLQEIHNMYSQIYELREDIKAAQLANTLEVISEKEDKITELILDIHSSFKPKKHRIALHKMLNSMEFQQIDQMMDTEASKNATLMPIDLSDRSKDFSDNYYNLNLSSLNVENHLKYLQVETSGVKEKAKVGVQKKVLLPADIPLLIETLSKEELSAEDRASLTALGNFFTEYNQSLKEGADARFNYLKTIIRKNQDLDITKMYSLIQESLKSQDAPMSTIKLFDVKPDGSPAINPNLPMVRKMVEYFFFSHYSQHVTDEKAAGFKSFHISAYGWNVLVNNQNKVITDMQYEMNPEKYETDEYYSRPLGVQVETDEDGNKTYWTEVIVPMPEFKTEKERNWYMDNMRKAFGTRIPTEDKRSMIAMKIVDFIDASKLNSVIVPQYIHILAGSDFDIDSLFGQMYATYKNAMNDTVKYGDTSMYKNKEAGEFVEFLHYMESKPEFKELIKERRKEFIGETKSDLAEDYEIEFLDIKPGTGLYTLLNEAYGFSEEDIEAMKEYQDDKEQIKELKAEIEKLYQEKNAIKDELFNSSGKAMDLAKAQGMHDELHAKNKKRYQEISKVRELGQSLDTSNKILSYIYAYKPVMDVLEEFAVPVTFDSYKTNPVFGGMVGPRYQNNNLDASLKMLSNKVLFDQLYINEKTSDKMFDDILFEMTGLKVDDMIAKGDIHTIDSVIASKADTSSFKDGIGIAANTNKFLSLAATYKLELSDEAVIWNYKQTKEDGKFEQQTKTTFHELNEKDQRAIEIIGGILGVFTDGAKKPLPAALQLNEVNANVALVMASLGMDPGLVMSFGFMPEVKKAVLKVKQAQDAVTEDFHQELVWFNNAIADEMIDILTTDRGQANEIWAKLRDVGLVKEKKGVKHTRWDVNTDNLIIDFEAKGELDLNKLSSNTLTLAELGITVSSTQGKIEDEAQKAVLLNLYAKQISQLWNIKKAGSLTSFHKRLNPNLGVFDKLKAGYDFLRDPEQKLFTPESLGSLLAEDSVYSVATETIDDMYEQLGHLFIERSSEFKGFTDLFGPLMEDKARVADVFSSLIASRAYINSVRAKGDLVMEDDISQDYVDRDLENLEQVVHPTAVFNTALSEELSEMQAKHPKNTFLSKLRASKGSEAAMITDGTKERLVKEQNIRLIGKLKLKGSLLEDVKADVIDLYNSGLEGKLFVKKLFYNEIVRTGGQTGQTGGYMNLFPNSLLEEFSQNLENVVSMIKYANRVIEIPGGKFFVNNETFDTRKKAEAYAKKNPIDLNAELTEIIGEDYGAIKSELMDHLSYSALTEKGNSKIPHPKITKVNVGNQSGTYRTGFAWAVKNTLIGQENTPTPAELSSSIYDLLEKTFEVEFAERRTLNYKGASFDLSNPYTHKGIEEELTINAHWDYNLNFHLGNMAGVRATTVEGEMDMETGETERIPGFIYPAVLRVGKNVYQLETVDGNNISESINDLDSNQGTTATYKVIDTTLLNSTTNLFGWDAINREEYAKYISGKTKLKMNEAFDNPLDSSQEEGTSKDIVTEGNVLYTSDLESLKSLHNRGAALYTLRVSEKQTKAGFAPKGLTNQKNFGNPFTGTNKEGAIKTESVTEAVQAFEDWLDGKAHKNVEPGRREWILKQIENLKGKNLKISYFRQGYRSHADVIDERINGAKSKKVVMKAGSKMINDTDLAAFKSYMEQSGKLPMKFFTASSVFKEFYSGGKRKPAPQNTSWIKNGNDLYDLTDLTTGEMFIADVDLRTGKQMDVTLASEEMEPGESPTVAYTPKGKDKQTYTIKGSQIFNQSGKEVFKGDSVDRNRIFANLVVQQGRAVVVSVDNAEYVVSNNNKVISVKTGKFITKSDIVKKVVAVADAKRQNIAKGNPNNIQKPDQDDVNGCIG
jgi:hypothetical protein